MTENIYLNIYGCSWSHGVKHLDYGRSWPYYLSYMLPKNVIIRNFAILGSSLEYSIFQLHNNKNNSNINIFQITNPYRFSIWNDNYFVVDNMNQVTSNYFDFAKDNLYDQYNSYGFSNLDEDKEIKKWFKRYIDLGTQKSRTIDINRIANIFYILNNTDYCFGYITDKTITECNIDCIDKEIPINEYSKDNGNHFDQTGNKLLANYVYKRISKKLEDLLNEF